MTASTTRELNEEGVCIILNEKHDNYHTDHVVIHTPDEVACEDFEPNLSRLGRKRPRPNLTRLVSQDVKYISENDDEDTQHTKNAPLGTEQKYFNPFYISSPAFIANHIKSLRLEAELFPMRQLIARIMSHLTHNRKGLFNSPVDTVALNLPDYNRIIKKPMDLGTVKARLHAVAYNNRDEVAEDIRLVFDNAMTYNPPNNFVHISAKKLLRSFEEAFQVLKATSPLFTSIIQEKSVTIKPQQALKIIAPDSHQSYVPPKASCVTPVSLGEAYDNFGPILDVETVSPPPEKLADTSSVPCMKSRRRITDSTLENPRAGFEVLPQAEKALKRAMNIAAKHAKHSCLSCRGRTCAICQQGCLLHEPSIQICSGSNCSGAKIRKGATYYIAKDGSRQFCQRCYTNLQTVLPHTSDQVESFGSSVRYKRDLLKRKNEEEIAEAWLTCVECKEGVHKVCSMHNEFLTSKENYRCPLCTVKNTNMNAARSSTENRREKRNDVFYTFVSGADMPVRLDTLLGNKDVRKYSAEALPISAESNFIEARVRDCIRKRSITPNVEKTITVRIISDCSKKYKVPDVIRKHFRLPSKMTGGNGVVPPVKVCYKSKAITLFQKIDGFDICIFCMYVHEYDGEDEFEKNERGEQKKRVYIAYLDSVEHFRPRRCRSSVFQEIIIAYLAIARARGYEAAHIWACPPSRGNSFVFWNHPSSQRTPTKERLHSWYHGVISKGIKSGVITDVKSLFETSFPFTTTKSLDATLALSPENMKLCEDGVLDGRMLCPPLMDGDYWIEEAVQLRASNIMRHLNSKRTPRETGINIEQSPALQVASLLRDQVMLHEASVPFRRPVNAAALKLNDYHKIITKPMDLGTAFSQCLLGEYDALDDLVSDVELVFSNAMKYNPKGHYVHNLALECQRLFFKELDSLTLKWHTHSKHETVHAPHSWEQFRCVKMGLDNFLDLENFASNSASYMQQNFVKNDDNEAPSKAGSVVAIKPVLTPLFNNPSNTLLPNNPRPISPPVKLLQSSVGVKKSFISANEDSIIQNMVGDDIWMLDKKALNNLGKNGGKKKGPNKGTGKRKKNNLDCSSLVDSVAKRRRQSWLGEEVALSIRRMRTSFFSCSLIPKSTSDEDSHEFKQYISSFNELDIDSSIPTSRIADSRRAFLEFSQCRNLEFDTIRRAKYSTSVLLYHFHNDSAPGLTPSCSLCKKIIQNIRWHRIGKIVEQRRIFPALTASKVSQISATEMAEACHKGEELCVTCYETRRGKEEFIPFPVSIKAQL